MEFWKLTASGNDFICIDNRSGRYDGLLSDNGARAQFARQICSRGPGIGADGLVFAGTSASDSPGEISSLTLEADGSECELCGNGMACLAKYAHAMGMGANGLLEISTPAGTITAMEQNPDVVSLTIPPPADYRPDIRLDVDGEPVSCDYIIAGIPHTATFVGDLEAVDVSGLGYLIRHHELFKPRGVNANFVKILETGSIAIRTFEFGVEGETLACGTGSCASAVLAARREGWNEDFVSGERPILVNVRSGGVIRVYLDTAAGGEIGNIRFETNVQAVMKGRIDSAWADQTAGIENSAE
jgi:diaminopimelate epimerase